MGIVTIFLTFNGTTAYLADIDEEIIREHSVVARAQLSTISQSAAFKRVDLVGASSGPMKWVLGQIERYGYNLRIKTGDRKFPETIMLYQALEALQIDPAQPKVYNHLKGHISHNKMTPTEVNAIQTAFGRLSNDNELWFMTARHLASDFVHDKYTATEYAALVDECEKFPALNGAVLNRMDEVNVQMAEREEQKARRQAAVDQKKARMEQKNSGHRFAHR